MEHNTHHAGRRAGWLKQLHRWHWISAAISLIGLLLFSVTGITLNHAGDIKHKSQVEHRELSLPDSLRPLLLTADQGDNADANSKPLPAPLPAPVADWLTHALNIDIARQPAEWSAEEVYVPLPCPGGDAWLRIARDDGSIEYESTDQGWIAYFNDLHKGRNTGSVWAWFIDLFAIACLLSSLTGLLILQFHAGQRPSTWPLVGLGLVIPLILALLFIH